MGYGAVAIARIRICSPAALRTLVSRCPNGDNFGKIEGTKTWTPSACFRAFAIWRSLFRTSRAPSFLALFALTCRPARRAILNHFFCPARPPPVPRGNGGMHFFVPKWVRHGRGSSRNAVYSVDLQPHASRLATAGQDATVKIWALPVIAAHAVPAPAGVPQGHAGGAASAAPPPPSRGTNGALATRAPQDAPPPEGALLASLASHSAAVNCVRWAPRGDRLASGGDDAVVLIYEREAGSAPVSAFAAASGAGVESWRVLRPFRGHAGDVTHVCWSPNGERIASASVDNLVIVWNVRGHCALTRLEGHSGFVKGVAWDPVGKFIASQSDDRSVRVWRTSDWKIEKVITEPFESAVFQENSTAFFLRLDWSPCGSQLLTVNARKKPLNCAPMFSRESGFTEQIEFVGHLEPVVCTRFSPRLYRARDAPNMAPYTVLVLGAKDSGASVWQASGALPFFRMAEMFEAEVLDLAWSTDGYTFVACSTDGQIMYIKFTPEELGDVVPLTETNVLFKEHWRRFGGGQANGATPPEYPAQLRAASANATALVEPVPTSIMETPTPTPVPAVPQAVHLLSGPTPPADPAVLAAQNETRVKGGKRRITPVAITAVNGSSSHPPGPVATQTSAAPMKRARVDAMNPFFSRGASGQSTATAPISMAVSARVPFGATDAYAHRMSGIPGSGNAVSALPPGAKELSYATPLCPPSIIGLSLMLLPTSNEGGGRCRFISTDTPPTVLESKEEQSVAGGFTVSCSKGGKVLWRDYHPRSGAIVALAGIANKFVAAAAEDGVLFLYSAASGRRIAPPISLDSAPHILEAFCQAKEGPSGNEDFEMVPNGETRSSTNSERWFLLVISRSALCSVFDVSSKRLVCARSAAPLLSRAVGEGNNAQAKISRSVVLARVTAEGEPVLVLSDRHAFVYSRDFCAWVRVADNSAPNSEFTRALPSNKKVGILRSLQASASGSASPIGSLAGMGDITRAAAESLAHLETLLEAAIVLNAPDDYRYYLSCYASRIASAVKDDVENCRLRLRELCDFLINTRNPSEDRTVLGMSGRVLLAETVLPIITANRELQRLAEEYDESLQELQRRAAR